MQELREGVTFKILLAMGSGGCLYSQSQAKPLSLSFMIRVFPFLSPYQKLLENLSPLPGRQLKEKNMHRLESLSPFSCRDAELLRKGHLKGDAGNVGRWDSGGMALRPGEALVRRNEGCVFSTEKRPILPGRL